MNNYILDKLTLVIFTYNRQKYLKRTVNYWANYNLKLLILDGSNKKFQDKCLEKKNIKYIHDPRGLYERLLSSINFIDTEFMILGSDDEFYLPSALTTCIKFLSKNSNFSSCGGRAIGFLSKGKNVYGTEQYPKLKDLSLDDNSAYDRIFKHFSVYVPSHFYSIIRSTSWKKICSYVFQKRFQFNAAHELQVEFLVMVAGKSKIIPELMWLRNKQVPVVNYDIVKLAFRKWWFGKSYKNEKLDFLNYMKNACEKISNNKSLELTEEQIEILFDLYISKPVFKKNPLKKIYNFIQHQIKKIIKFIFKREKIRYNSLINQAKILASQGVSINYQELDNVISILQNSKSKN